MTIPFVSVSATFAMSYVRVYPQLHSLFFPRVQNTVQSAIVLVYQRLDKMKLGWHGFYWNQLTVALLLPNVTGTETRLLSGNL